jgi:CheY-like chemotaxis protein
MTQPLVLLVDDIPDHARFYEVMLKQRGYRVNLVRSAGEALHAARTERPDCTVIDVRLPDKDGWELCRALKSDRALAATPIVILTADVSETCASDASRSGCSAWIAHPINAHDIVRTVDYVLAQQRPTPVDGDALVGARACLACGSTRVRATLRLGTIQYFCCQACRLCWRDESAEIVA